MQQHLLKPPKGARKQRNRVGRGDGSGSGSYSGRGMKGLKSRSGGTIRPGYQGGQIPLVKALPSMRGFTNIFRKEYNVVNIDGLARFPPDSEVTPQLLVQSGIVKNLRKPIKVLGRGEIEAPLTVEAHKFSTSARAKIEGAGGSVREIG